MFPVARSIRLLGVLACVAIAACQAPSAATNRPTNETLAPSAGDVPATTAAASSDIAMQTPGATTVGTFTLTSSAFAAGAAIPRTYACDGQDTSPPLEWTGAPDGTVTLALVMTDRDAGGFVHWVFFNVNASASGGIPTGFSASPDGPAQGKNSFGKDGYGGPCPPSGTHHYDFRLLALDSMLDLGGSPSAKHVLDAAQGHTLGEAKLTGTYQKGS
jgi:hypothetical protein